MITQKYGILRLEISEPKSSSYYHYHLYSCPFDYHSGLMRIKITVCKYLFLSMKPCANANSYTVKRKQQWLQMNQATTKAFNCEQQLGEWKRLEKTSEGYLMINKTFFMNTPSAEHVTFVSDVTLFLFLWFTENWSFWTCHSVWVDKNIFLPWRMPPIKYAIVSRHYVHISNIGRCLLWR